MTEKIAGAGNLSALFPTYTHVRLIDTVIQSPSRDSTTEAAVVDRAMPVIEMVIRRRCSDWPAGLELRDDLRAEVIVRLLRRLRETAGAADAAIENLEGYVAGIATRVIDDAIRVSRPEWTRLKHRVRYLVTHDDRFRFNEEHIVGLASTPLRRRGRARNAAAEDLSGALLAVLRDAAGGELALDEAVRAVAQRMGISDQIADWDDELPIDQAVGPAASAESTDTLRHLWSEIVLLPPRQRTALLFSARDEGGESVVRLLAMSGVVSARHAAGALEMSERELSSVLEDLPWSDAVIARRLGVTPQQVINLRKAARDRLARRMERPR